MPKTRQQKEETFSQAKADIKDAKSLVFVGYHGLTVPQVEELRSQLREEQVKLQVIKKTLIKKVLDDAGIDVDVKNLGDGLAVAYSLNDEVSAAKVLANFQKDNEALQLYGGVLEEKFIDDAGIMALSKLLSKPELYAKLVGSINAPVSGFVNTLGGVMRGMVNVLNGIKDAKA
ncbi:50S ribosomal protein L10 [bacterium]|jgi:large subunit ribosomal protein L10|nr:50S ribosomal protein L10 [bacterium]MDP6571227.1 50S ribosomal protein L10 [Patescibacteria group bacterium]MDP6756214.1 50S ribosomal protein L10 [Patescibacteria group bacterium]|tara:strand:+ start:14727 stop:15248 length:522 start_codon:yes stop_codon:yes gene_type:complete